MKASSWVTCFALVQLFLLALAIIYRIKEKYAIYGGTGKFQNVIIMQLHAANAPLVVLFYILRRVVRIITAYVTVYCGIFSEHNRIGYIF